MKVRRGQPADETSSAALIHKVEVFRFRLDVEDDELRRLRAHLSEDEIARAERFVQPGHGNWFIAARGRLRQALGNAMGCEPAMLAFDIGASGKPSLSVSRGDRDPLHFNLTHSGGVAAIAMCRSAEVGIDIEKVRPVHEGLAQRYFAAVEVAELQALPEPQRLDAFFRCWTRKEAFLKTTGEGIKRGLDSFVVSVQPDAPARIISIDNDEAAGEAFSVADFDAGPGMAGAVCVHTGTPEQRMEIALRDFS